MNVIICVDVSRVRRTQRMKQVKTMNGHNLQFLICIRHLYFTMYTKPHESLQAKHDVYHSGNKVMCMLCNLSLIYKVLKAVFLRAHGAR